MKLKLVLILLLCSFFACQSPSLQFGKATRFFPPSTQLEKGIVNKYYSHVQPIDPNHDKSMDIQYHAYRLVAPDRLEMNVYDAAMQLTWHSMYHYDNEVIKITDRYRVFQEDTSTVNMVSDTFLDWKTNHANLEYSMMIGRNNDYKRIYQSNQAAQKDTVIDGRTCRQFEKDIQVNVIAPEGDTTNYQLRQQIIYAEHIGIYKEYMKTETANTHLELMEQMTLEEFNNKATKIPKRIAYIDPRNTLDNNTNFKTCDKETQIADYYNGDEIGQLIGGKGQWWRILETELKSSKLHNESGFLTYRFVVNCQGQAGRFVTEQADLNYNKKAFHPETVDHFYEIVSNQKEWQPCKIKEDIRDAYVYVTFKLKDGKVIEILP